MVRLKLPVNGLYGPSEINVPLIPPILPRFADIGALDSFLSLLISTSKATGALAPYAPRLPVKCRLDKPLALYITMETTIPWYNRLIPLIYISEVILLSL